VTAAAPDVPRASLTLKVLATVAVVVLLKFANDVVLPIAIAIILTFVLAPVVRVLRRRGLDEAIGAAVVVFGLVGVVAWMAVRLAEPASEWIARAPTTLQQAIDGFDRVRHSIPMLSPPAPTPPRTRGAAPIEQKDPVKEKLATEGVALTGVLLLRLGSIAITSATSRPSWARRR
jgi:predicted PurR-regulated permease PerM